MFVRLAKIIVYASMPVNFHLVFDATANNSVPHSMAIAVLQKRDRPK